MDEAIQQKLLEIEEKYEVKILYACESGSRAWGFPSADSDYDVRFIYLRPQAWYLSINLEHKRDVIELPIENTLDINGWDLRKALKLFAKTNPPLLEWLGSPIIYQENYSVIAKLRALLKNFYSGYACMYHYWNMVKGKYRNYVRDDTVRLKQYFYLLRPLLAIRWLERDWGVPPTEFSTLVDEVLDDASLIADIKHLIERKKQGNELAQDKPITSIGNYIDAEMTRLQDVRFEAYVNKPKLDDLNQLFRESLLEVWQYS